MVGNVLRVKKPAHEDVPGGAVTRANLQKHEKGATAGHVPHLLHKAGRNHRAICHKEAVGPVHRAQTLPGIIVAVAVLVIYIQTDRLSVRCIPELTLCLYLGQFAYRLLLPASVMLSLSGGIYFSQLIRERNSSLWLSLLTLFCFFSTAFPVLRESVQNRTVDKRLFVMQDNRVSGGEYMPLGLDNTFPGKNADTVLITESDTIFLDNDGLVRLGSGNHWRDVVAWMPFPNPFDGLRTEAERCSRG